MRRLSEIKGEEALDVAAELLEPIAEIAADKTIKEAYENGTRASAVAAAIKGHKKAIIKIFALLDGADPETYEVNLATLPAAIMTLLSDPDLKVLFQ